VRADDLLAERIAASGATRIACLGLAKNVGKTTALVAALSCLHETGLRVGATSAGRDGEAFDAITGERKPRFHLRTGQLVASAESTFAAGAAQAQLVRRLPFATRFGAIELRRMVRDGDVEVIGPVTSSQLSDTAAALEGAGAQLVLVDGAFGRRAFASARVSDGVVLSVGLAAGASLDSVLERARSAVALIRLPPPPPGRPARFLEGALTDARVSQELLRAGECLVAEDFASVFLSSDARRRLDENGVSLAVRRPARLIAVTANPTAPGRTALAARAFFDELRQILPDVTLVDVLADLAHGV
jgi:hypothetical protein